ncbi:MAG TPA: hypothetical protein VHB46_13380 [Burkholderiales bacterium]|nr:hypothetical protein [Burkholderiales bacterium]
MKFVGQLLSTHLQRYPAMQLDDIYKLLHQAALGPGHAVTDAAAARKRLDEEIASLADGIAEPDKDVISPDGRLARIHLRAWLAGKGDPGRLHRAFVETANTYPSSPDKLAKFCACLADLADAGGIPFTRAQVEPWFARIAGEGYPPVHHSAAFRNAYRPAYRVVAIDLLHG